MKLYINRKQSSLLGYMYNTLSQDSRFSVVGSTAFYLSIKSLSCDFPASEILNLARDFCKKDSRLMQSYRACHINYLDKGSDKIILFYFV